MMKIVILKYKIFNCDSIYIFLMCVDAKIYLIIAVCIVISKSFDFQGIYCNNLQTEMIFKN